MNRDFPALEPGAAPLRPPAPLSNDATALTLVPSDISLCENLIIYHFEDLGFSEAKAELKMEAITQII